MPADLTPPDQDPPPARGSRRAGVVALALVGLALTAGITYAASTLVSQPIGLTSEPATVGDSLAPGAPVTTTPTSTTGTPPSGSTTITTTVTVPEPVPVPVPVPASPSNGDGDRGSGEGDGDDD